MFAEQFWRLVEGPAEPPATGRGMAESHAERCSLCPGPNMPGSWVEGISDDDIQLAYIRLFSPELYEILILWGYGSGRDVSFDVNI